MTTMSRVLHALLFTITLTASSSLMSDSNRWSSADTIAAGILVGCSNGWLSRITDAVFPFNWLLLNEIQSLVTKAIINDAHRKDEEIDATLLKDSTWLSSWISYLIVLNHVPVSYTATPILFRVTVQ